MSLLKSIVKAVVPTKQKITNVGKALTGTVYNVAREVVQVATINTVKLPTYQFSTPNKVLTSIVQNPAKTALVGTVAAAPKAAVTIAAPIVSKVGSTVSKTFASLKPTTKVAVIAAAPIAVPFVATSKTAQKAIVNYPSQAATFGKDIAKFTDTPTFSNAKNIVTNSPVLSSVAGGAALIAVGAGTAGVITTLANTQAVKKNTAVTSTLTNPIAQSPILKSDSIKDQIKLAKEQSQATIDQMKLASQLRESEMKTEAKIKEKQLSSQPVEAVQAVAPVAPATAPVTTVIAPTTKKKKATKKKAKKKKKKAPKKKKKAPKKKKKKKSLNRKKKKK